MILLIKNLKTKTKTMNDKLINDLTKIVDDVKKDLTEEELRQMKERYPNTFDDINDLINLFKI